MTKVPGNIGDMHNSISPLNINYFTSNQTNDLTNHKLELKTSTPEVIDKVNIETIALDKSKPWYEMSNVNLNAKTNNNFNNEGKSEFESVFGSYVNPFYNEKIKKEREEKENKLIENELNVIKSMTKIYLKATDKEYLYDEEAINNMYSIKVPSQEYLETAANMSRYNNMKRLDYNSEYTNSYIQYSNQYRNIIKEDMDLNEYFKVSGEIRKNINRENSKKVMNKSMESAYNGSAFDVVLDRINKLKPVSIDDMEIKLPHMLKVTQDYNARKQAFYDKIRSKNGG